MTDTFERLYREYHCAWRRERDPVGIVHDYRDARDREVVAFVASVLSYGNVSTILSSCRGLLSRLGDRPRKAIIDRTFVGKLAGFRHRFTTAADMEVTLYRLSELLRRHGSIESFFCDGNMNMEGRLSRFVKRFGDLPLPSHLKSRACQRKAALKYLLPDPARGSACKRLNLFLRWVVRPADGIDLGLWSCIPANALILPVDVHILKTLRALKWTASQSASWKVAESATDRLRAYCPSDPIRYDFSLCHLSMTGGDINAF